MALLLLPLALIVGGAICIVALVWDAIEKCWQVANDMADDLKKKDS